MHVIGTAQMLALAVLAASPPTTDPAVAFTRCVVDNTASLDPADSASYLGQWRACSAPSSPTHPSALQPSTTLAAAAPLMDPGEGASHWLVDRILSRFKSSFCGSEHKCGGSGLGKAIRTLVGQLESANKVGRVGLLSLESVRSASSSIAVGMVEKSLKGSSSALFDMDDLAEHVAEFSNDHTVAANFYTYAKRVPGLALFQSDLVQRVGALPGVAANPKYTTALAAFAALGNTSTTLPYAPGAAPAPSLLQLAAARIWDAA